MTAILKCAECGHLHFDVPTKSYEPCPVEDCSCPMNPQEDS